MKKIAYFSPLNPIRSGISDYSEDLLPHLKVFFDIELFIPDNFVIQNEKIKAEFCIRTYSEFNELYYKKYYNNIIYHMGNSYKAHKEIYEFIMRYSGIVVLHDLSLHHFFAEKTLENGNALAYEEEMFYNHGYHGLSEAKKFFNGEIPPIWEKNSLQYPMNLRILDNAAGVIVHSEFAKTKLNEVASYVPITVAPIPAPHITKVSEIREAKKNARDNLQINEKTLVFSTLGFMNHTKRVDKILEVMADLKDEGHIKEFHFYIVGEVAESYPLEAQIKKLGLEKEVKITGFVDLKDFDQYIAASDICFNLRFPTQGENSASLLRIMGHGKPVITTDIGSFSEFPEGIVFKVPYDDEEKKEIKKKLLFLLENDLEMLNINIINFTKSKYTIHHCVKKYAETIEKINSGVWSNLYIPVKKVLNNYAKVINYTFNKPVSISDNYVEKICDTFNYSSHSN